MRINSNKGNFLFKSIPSNKEEILEFKYNHCATPNELLEQGKDPQLLLTSQKERQTFIFLMVEKILKLNLIISLHLTTNLQQRQGTMF